MALLNLDNFALPWMKGKQKPPLVPDDLKELDGGVATSKESTKLDYLWYQIEEKEGGHTYRGFRVVRLLELKFIPLDARADAGLLQKMRSVLRSIYGAKVSFVYLAGGLYHDPALGIIQCYGVSVFAETLDAAVKGSEEALFALKSAMTAVYRQMKLDPLDTRTGQWIFSAMAGTNHALVVVGQPDPRENAKGGSQALFTNPITQGDAGAVQYSLQQNEIMFRGMSNLKEDFIFLVMTSPVSLTNISEMLIGLCEQTASWASWQTGVRGASFGISLPAMLSGSMVNTESTANGTNEAVAHSDGVAHTAGMAHTQGQAHTEGHAETSGWTHSETDGVTITDTVGHTQGTTITDTDGHTDGVSSGVNSSSSREISESKTQGASVGVNVGANAGISDSTTVGMSLGNSQGHSAGESQSDTHSHAVAISESESVSRSVAASHSESNSVSGSVTNSESDTLSQSDTESESDTESQSDTLSKGASMTNMLGHSAGNGLTVGLAPSFSIHDSYSWQFDPAILITQILRMQQRLLETASKEGAYYTDAYLFPMSQNGKKALMGLVPESFGGVEDVITGVQTRELTPVEEQYIIRHAQVFSPSTRVETIPEIMSGYMDSSLLTLLQVAAYTSPGMYEMGTAVTVQEATPDFAYYPQMKGDVILGRQWASELAEITDAPLRLSPERHFHTAFAGDTGFGKSVSAERLAYETTVKWHYRTIVLDFGQGWRRALNWDGLEGRVDIRQVFPGAQRPLRWNIMQVPKRLDARHYRSMMTQLFTNAGRMGPRQQGFLRRAIDDVYENYGVLLSPKRTGYYSVMDDKELTAIHDRRHEAGLSISSAYIGAKLTDLPAIDQQAVAVYRSKKASFAEVVANLRQKMETIGKNDQASRTSLEGLLLRIETFEEGDMARQYGPGEDSLPIEDLGLLGEKYDPWGLVVVEGGAEMTDEFSKVAILSLLASILYSDAVTRRRESLAGMAFPPMQIFFEEANKVLGGVGGGNLSSEGNNTGADVSEIFQSMWRDGRKYKIFLHLMAQTISGLPEGIISSCNNIFVVQTKNARDRDMVMAHIGRSEKGFVNTEYKRYLARIPIAMALVKLGYSEDVTQNEPILVHPLRVPGEEPSDQEIVKKLGTR